MYYFTNTTEYNTILLTQTTTWNTYTIILIQTAIQHGYYKLFTDKNCKIRFQYTDANYDLK